MSDADIVSFLAERWPAVRIASAAWAVPELSLARILIESRTGDMEHETALEAVSAGRGWLRFQSAAYDGRIWRGDQRDRGRLMRAEWVDQQGLSCRFWLEPSGQERLFTCSEVGLGQTCTREALAQTVILAGHAKDRPLRYRVYWGGEPADPSAMGRLFSSFAGFGGG